MSARRTVLLSAVAILAVLVEQSHGSMRSSAFKKSARLGDVAAEVTWSVPYGDARMTIARKGEVLGRRSLRGVEPSALEVRDLDRDDEPEVILTVGIGGAHNRSYSLFFTFDPSAARYRVLKHWWHEIRPRVADLNQDGATEFIHADRRFAYVFTSFAFSYFPLQIWTYRQGRLADTTRKYRALIRKDAARHWRWYLQDRRQRDADVRGVLAAYQADMYLLGEEGRGWSRLRAALRRGELGPRPGLGGWPMGRRYLRALQRFLRATGYA